MLLSFLSLPLSFYLSILNLPSSTSSTVPLPLDLKTNKQIYSLSNSSTTTDPVVHKIQGIYSEALKSNQLSFSAQGFYTYPLPFPLPLWLLPSYFLFTILEIVSPHNTSTRREKESHLPHPTISPHPSLPTLPKNLHALHSYAALSDLAEPSPLFHQHVTFIVILPTFHRF